MKLPTGIESAIRKFSGLHPLWLSIIINVLLFSFSQCFSTIFHTNDDVALTLLTAGQGFFSEPSAYTIWTAPSWGHLLTFLYSTFQGIEWYTVSLEAFILISHTTFLYVILGVNKKLQRTLSSIALFCVYYLLIGAQYNIEVHYTMAAEYLSIAGFTLLVFKEKLSYKHLLVALALIIVSSQVRAHACIFMTIVAGSVYLARLILHKEESFLQGLMSLRTVFIAVAVFFSGLALITEDLQYKNAKAVQEVKELNSVLVYLSDYQMLDKLSEADRNYIFEKTGWSDVDYTMFKFNFYENDKVYGRSTVDELVEFCKDKVVLESIGADVIKTNFVGSLFSNRNYFVAITICLLLFYARMKREALLLLAFQVLCFVFIYIVFSIYLKPPPYRVYYPWLSYMSLLPMMMFGVESIKKYPQKIKYAPMVVQVMIAVLLIKKVHIFYVLSQYNKTEHETLVQDIDSLDIRNGKNLVFASSGLHFKRSNAYQLSELASGLSIYSIQLLNLHPSAQKQQKSETRDGFCESAIETPYVDFIWPESNNNFDVVFKEFFKRHYNKELTWVEEGRTNSGYIKGHFEEKKR